MDDYAITFTFYLWKKLMNDKLPDNIINLMVELNRCYGYDLHRQFVITSAVLIETTIIEILQENEIDILKIIKKPTLGSIIKHKDTRCIFTQKLLEICNRLNDIRYLGAHFSELNVDAHDSDYISSKIIEEFGGALTEATKLNPKKFEHHWSIFLAEYGKACEYKHIARTQYYLSVPTTITDNTIEPPRVGSYLRIFDIFSNLMHEKERLIFALLFKHKPDNFRQFVFKISELHLSSYITEYDLIKSLKLFSFLGLVFIGSSKTGNIIDAPIYRNESVYIQARKYCALFWDILMGEHLSFDPDPPVALFL